MSQAALRVVGKEDNSEKKRALEAADAGAATPGSPSAAAGRAATRSPPA